MKKQILLTLLFSLFGGILNGQQTNSSSQPASSSNENHQSIPKADVKEEQRGTKEEEDKEKSPHKFSGGVSFVSDYRDRGVSQTMLRPAVQGELKYTHQSGLYLKTWASNIDGTTHFINNTSMEWDFYIGMAHDILKSDFRYDIGFEFYYFPGGQTPRPPVGTSSGSFTSSSLSSIDFPFTHSSSSSSSQPNVDFRKVYYNTIEYYVGIEYKGFEIKLSQTLTDYFGVNSHNPPTNWKKGLPGFPTRPNGHSRGSFYIEGNYEWSPKRWPKFTGIAHLGYQTVTNYSELNYLDWQVGMTYKFDWFDFSLSYIATNAKKDFYKVPDNGFNPKKRNLGGPTVVAGITKSF